MLPDHNFVLAHGTTIGCNAASVIQYSGEIGNREWPKGWREIESKQKKTLFSGYTEVI